MQESRLILTLFLGLRSSMAPWLLTSDANLSFGLLVFTGVTIGVVILLASLVLCAGLCLLVGFIRGRKKKGYAVLKDEDPEAAAERAERKKELSLQRRTKARWFGVGFLSCVGLLLLLSAGTWLRLCGGSGGLNSGKKKKGRESERRLGSGDEDARGKGEQVTAAACVLPLPSPETAMSALPALPSWARSRRAGKKKSGGDDDGEGKDGGGSDTDDDGN